MPTEFLTRIVITLALLGGGVALYGLANRFLLSRLQGKHRGLESLRPGVPAILYFTAPGCAPCKTVQRPAIQALMNQLGENLQVIEINATEQPDLADYWGVLSVPTTFIIDARGRPRRVNHGVTRAKELLHQLQAVEAKSNYQWSVFQLGK